MMSETSGMKQRPAHLFKPGQSGNPAGRPKGVRHKLGAAFVKALYEDFQEYGESVIERVRVERPHAYLKIVAQLLPQEINLNVDAVGEMTDEQLSELLERVQQLIAAGTYAELVRAAGARDEVGTRGRLPAPN